MNLGFGLIFGAETSGAEKGIDALLAKVETLNGAVAHTSGEMSEAFEKIGGFLAKGVLGLATQAGEIEDSNQKLMFAYRADTEEARKNALAKLDNASLYTMQTQKELTEMATNMRQVLDVDMFSEPIHAAFMKTGKTIQGDVAGVFADLRLAAYSDTGFNHAMISMMNGNMKGAARFIPVIAAHMKDYSAAVGQGGTNTEKMARLMPLFVRDAGELTTYLSSTWPYLVHQIEDVKQKMVMTFGTPMMEQLKGPITSFLSYFTNADITKGPLGLLATEEGKRKLDGAKQAVREIGEAIANAAQWVGHLAKGMFEFVLAHPQIIKLAFAVGVAVAAFAGATAVLASVRIAIMAVNFAMGGLAILLSPVTLVLGALVAIGYMLAKATVGGNSFGETISRVGEVLAAAWEGLSNMTNGVAELSEGTAKSLGDNGLMGLATTLIMYGYRVKRFFEGLWDGLSDTFGPGGFAYEAFSYLGDTVKDLFGSIVELTGTSADSTSDKWHDAGQFVGHVVGTIVGAFAYGFALVIKVIDFAVKAVSMLIDALTWVGDKLDWVNEKWKTLSAGAETVADILGTSAPGGLAASDVGDAVGRIETTNGRTAINDATTRMNVMSGGLDKGMARPAAQQVNAMLNPDHRDVFTKATDTMFAKTGHGSGSDYLSRESQISKSSDTVLAQQLAELKKLSSGGFGIFIDGDKVGSFMNKQGGQDAERSGKLGK